MGNICFSAKGYLNTRKIICQPTQTHQLKNQPAATGSANFKPLPASAQAELDQIISLSWRLRHSAPLLPPEREPLPLNEVLLDNYQGCVSSITWPTFLSHSTRE